MRGDIRAQAAINNNPLFVRQERHRLLKLRQVRNDVVAVLLLLEARERHLGALDVLLGVLTTRIRMSIGCNSTRARAAHLEVLEERVVGPRDAALLVGLRVRVA